MLLDFAFPCFCLLCQEPTNRDDKYLGQVCESCMVNMPAPPLPDDLLAKYQSNFSLEEIYLDGVYSVVKIAEDDKYFQLVKELKYNDKRHLGKVMGLLMANLLPYNIVDNIDIVCPVPIHNVRLIERTYNQSDLLASQVANTLKLNYIEHLARRKRYRLSQTKISAYERFENAKEIFEIGTSNVSKKNILIVDDVFTTGSTINALASVFVQAGAKSCYALTFAAS